MQSIRPLIRLKCAQIRLWSDIPGRIDLWSDLNQTMAQTILPSNCFPEPVILVWEPRVCVRLHLIIAQSGPEPALENTATPRLRSRHLFFYDQNQSSAHPCVPRPKLQGLDGNSSAIESEPWSGDGLIRTPSVWKVWSGTQSVRKVWLGVIFGKSSRPKVFPFLKYLIQILFFSNEPSSAFPSLTFFIFFR